MADNVKALFGAAPSGQPVPEIVAMLERMTAKARSGELRGFACACAGDNGIGHEFHFEADAKFEAGAAVMALHHRVARMMAGGDE